MLVRKAARRPARRSGATLVEMAIVYSALFLVLSGLILGSIAIFHYQQVARLAREGSRWAAVHGADWATENKQLPTTPQNVYDQAVRPKAHGMDLSKLSCSVSWDVSQQPYRPYVDAATNTVKGTVYVGRSPHEAFFTPDGREVWVTVRGENYVSVIDPAQMQETRRIAMANGPGMTMFRPDGRYAFVCSSFTP